MSEKVDENNEPQAEGTAHKEDLETRDAQAPQEEADASAQPNDVDPSEKVVQLEKDHLYLRAELENIKRQHIKERSQLLKYGAERLARDLLETLDVFNSALQSEVNENNFSDFVNGIKMTQQSLKTALEKHGITELACLEKPFDPNTQEALSSEFKEGVPEGHVTQVFKPPYTYHDKLLRPGQVIVGRAKSE